LPAERRKNVNKSKLVLPYSLVQQAAADMMMGASHMNSTYFDPDTLARIERMLKNAFEAVLDKNISVEFLK
jgi:hypothetical protein